MYRFYSQCSSCRFVRTGSCFILGWLLLAGCGAEAPLTYELALDQTIHNAGVHDYLYRRQHFGQLQPDLPWRGLDSLIRSDQPLPPSGNRTLVLDPAGHLRSARVWSADLHLPHHAFRLSLLTTYRRYRDTEQPQGGWLLLSPAGQDSTAITFGHANIGPMGSVNYFQVDRSWYRISAIDWADSTLTVAPVDRPPGRHIVARYSTRLGKVPLLDAAGETIYLSPPQDRPRLYYIFSFGPDGGRLLRALDRARTLRETVDIVPIVMLDPPAVVEQFFRDNSMDLPFYRLHPQTCRSLNCHSLLPYGIWVEPGGRVRSYYLSAETLQAWIDH